MNALVTKALPNEDESQCGPLLPRKHLHVWLHYQMRNTNVDEWLFVDTGSGGGEKKNRSLNLLKTGADFGEQIFRCKTVWIPIICC